ncbi:MAG: hypothetical protein E6K22_10405 [Gammaproteobacteria bacterium]|nr:MAG: hypothetical protein E6K22_10405 [Gammaproteobacteria bacterium]
MQDAKQPFWREVWIQVTAGLIVTAVAAWRWQNIKPYLATAGALITAARSAVAYYLAGSVHVRRWLLLALLGACVALPAMIMRSVSWWHARRSERELALVVPHDFSPTVLQRAVIVLMLENYPHSISADDAALSIMGRIPGQHVTRAQAELVLEELCRVYLIAPERNGGYRLTGAGRDWTLANLDKPWTP